MVRYRKSGENTLAGLRSIRAACPDDEWIFVILDNLSAHKGSTLRKWAKGNKVELCFTPTYSSWANLIEPHLGPLREFVLNNSNHPNHVVPTRRLHAYLRGATPTPAPPNSSKLNDTNGHESAPNDNNDGGDQQTEAA